MSFSTQAQKWNTSAMNTFFMYCQIALDVNKNIDLFQLYFIELTQITKYSKIEFLRSNKIATRIFGI